MAQNWHELFLSEYDNHNDNKFMTRKILDLQLFYNLFTRISMLLEGIIIITIIILCDWRGSNHMLIHGSKL